MRLRRKTLVILAVTAIALVVGACATLRVISLGNVARSEKQRTDERVKAASDALAAELQQLTEVAGRWGASDSASAFVQGLDPYFKAEHLTAQAFKALRADFMVFIDADGKIVRAQTYDPATGQGVAPPEGLVEQVAPGSPILTPASGSHSVMGVLSLADGLAVAASHPILDSQHRRPARGTLVVGRLLGAQELAYLAQKAGGPVGLSSPLKGGMSSGPGLVRDVGGQPVAQLMVDLPTGVRRQSQGALWYLVVAFLSGGAAFAGVAGLVMDMQGSGRRAAPAVSAKIAPVGGTMGESAPPAPAAPASAPVAAVPPSAAAPAGAGTAGEGASGVDATAAAAALSTAVASTAAELAAIGATDDPSARAAGLEQLVRERIALLSQANAALTAEMAERTKTESALRESEQRHRSLVDNMADAVFVMTTEGRFDFTSPRATALTGYPPERLREMSYPDLAGPDSRELVERQINQLHAGEIGGPFEATFVHANGRSIPVELSTSALTGPGGELVGVQWIARDIAERKRYEYQLGHMATHDYLTGLFNRRRFEEELTRRLAEARRHKTQGTLLLLDLDRFMDINDTLGHRAGDEILVRVATSIQERCRSENVVARMGGDEFALLLPHTDEAEALIAADRTLTDIRNARWAVDGHDLRVTASLGIALYPWHGTTIEDVLAHADLAVYRAKNEGRDRACMYREDEDWQTEVRTRRTWAQKIQDALDNDQFTVYAQPILDPETGKVPRYELLVRMQGEQGEIITPAAFLGTAEDLGLIRQIDRWMIAQALDLIAEHRLQGREIRLDVNLSTKAFSDDGLLEYVRGELARTGVDPSLLGMEITETAAIDDMGKALEFIRQVKSMGCRFALDNFGSGFSSFYYLKNLPVDVLKIDGSLIQNLPNSPQDQHLVKAIVELAKGLGVKATAEYVEEEATLKLLKEYGVDYAQGYHIGRPRPASEIV